MVEARGRWIRRQKGIKPKLPQTVKDKAIAGYKAAFQARTTTIVRGKLIPK